MFRYTAAGQKVAKLVYQTGKLLPQRTDYLGPYQYEDDSLRFFPHAEGRVLRLVQYDAANQPTTRYEREFTFKDHLGNLRLAYRLGQTHIYRATLEQDRETHTREALQFDTLSVRPPIAATGVVAHTGAYVAKLNAGGLAPQPLGPLTQFTVQKGDVVKASALGLYPQAVSNQSFAFSLAGFVASLLQPAASPQPAGIENSRRGALPLLQVGLAAGIGALPQLPGGVPKGYLRMLVFNEDSVLVGQPITVALQGTALNNYDSLNIRALTITQNGYVSVYVGNESAADVYFDDVTIEHRQGLQVQENQYDPWGLSLTGLDYISPEHKQLNHNKFNGKEEQEDLGLSWKDYGARFYDAALGRWGTVDPLASVQPSESPYVYVSNCPTSFSDVGGGFKIPAWMQMKYPALFQLLVNTAPDIIFNPAAIQKISEFTHLSPERIKTDAQFGSGPELVPNAALGNAIAQHTEGTIYLNEEYLDKLEQLSRSGTSEDQRSIGFLIMVSIFHEYIHYGRFVNKLPGDISYADYASVSKGANFRDGEPGHNWEKQLFGTTIADDNDAETPTQQPARKYLNKYEGGKYMPVPGTDVTKGMAPDKKKDKPRPLPTHKPKERKAGQ